MNSFIVRNMPEGMHLELKILAAKNNTTMNKIVIEAIRKLLVQDKKNG